MNYAVELIVTTNPQLRANGATPSRRLPWLHDTIADARAAGAEFLRLNGAYIASKGPSASIAMFQVVDDGGDIVVAPTRARAIHVIGPAS